MAAFQKVALVQSCHSIPPTHEYYLPDLIEIAGLAAVIREQVADIDLPVSPLDRDADRVFEQYLKERRPELVGISTFTCGAKSAMRQAAMAKRHGAVVMMGGYHPTARPEEALRSGLVDVVVRGEGELTFEEFVRTGRREGVAGLSYLDGERIVHNPDRELIDDLDALPLPLRELRPQRFGLSGRDYHTDTIFTSRGCPARCTFCANNLVGKRWRKRGIESLLVELQQIPPPAKKDWKIVKLWDSNFLTEVERIEELCDGIIQLGLQRHFRFIAETRANDIVRGAGILPRMREAGFVRIGCGVESPDKETRKRLKKGLDITHVDKAAELLTKSDIQFTKFLIVGHPKERERDILDYVDYSLGQGVELQNTTFFVMTPYPGTVLGEQYEADGLVQSFDWDLYTNFCAVVAPEGMDTQKMQSLLCSVSLRYGAQRRFLKGKSSWSAIGRVLEMLLTHARVGSVHPLHTRADVERGLYEALESAAGRCEREARASARPGLGERLGLRLHARDGRSIAIGLEREGATDALVIGPARRAHGPELHVSLPHLVGLVSRLPHIRLASDIQTLKWNPRAFRLAWAPSFGWELLKVAGWSTRMLAFHLSRALRPSRALTPEAPRAPASAVELPLEADYELPAGAAREHSNEECQDGVQPERRISV